MPAPPQLLNKYMNKAPAIAPAPPVNPGILTDLTTRIRERRRAFKAQGAASTVRTDSLAMPYTTTPKALLGS